MASRSRLRRAHGLALALAAVVIHGCEEAPAPLTELVDFPRDVQPILAEHCFGCHGPDEAARAAGLRLDTFEDATADRGGGRFAIVPRDPDASLALTRAGLADPTRRMPPAPRRALSPEELDTLRQWILAGAPYGRHWAFGPIERPAPPGGAAHPVDAFVRARLAEQGLAPAPRAAPAVLFRRLSLDVRGLPPSPEESAEFLEDPSDDAYEAWLDRWLAEPAHAERLAMDWLDGAGYGDTNGLHADDPRASWLYRDWLIAAFAENQPLDTMIVAQLAGDLLPGATDEDVLATGYLRLHATTGEGGVDPGERRLAHSLDRAQLVGNQLLGLTVQCARCHDHKYDPISQLDAYALVACFDRVADHGVIDSPETEAPTLETTSPLWPARRAVVEPRMAELQARVDEPDAWSGLEAWLAALGAEPVHFERPDRLEVSALLGTARVDGRGTVQATGTPPIGETTTLRLTHGAVIHAVRLELGAGRSALLPWLTEVTLDVDAPAGRHRVRVARAFLDDGTDVRAVIDGANTTGLEAGAAMAVTLVPDAPIDASSGSLVVRVDQRHGRRSVFGSLRPTVSSQPAAALSPPLARAAAAPSGTRTPDDAHALRSLFAEIAPTSPLRSEAAELARLRAEHADGERGARARVMREDDPERRTRVLERGQWGQPGVRVRCAVPATLRIDRPVDVADRLALARWIVGPDNPITARVLANRYARLALRRSLVATPDDWGTRGGAPTHRALLDWLADELRSSGWDLRHLLRVLFTSETYRQSSLATPDALASDPTNALLGRAERTRLEAELLRDQALVASGLLIPGPGGPPAFVPHPDGLYEAVGDGLGALTSYPVDRAPARQHRRALYTFWRRGLPHPSLSLLDAPERIHGVAQREETSTPTQALALLHDPFFVEAARVLAHRAYLAHPADPDARIAEVFARVLARSPSAEELTLLRASHDLELAEISDHTDADAILRVGESDVAITNAPEEAALALVARAVLSSSEAVTRE